MAPYNIDRDTRLQHNLYDTLQTDPSLASRLLRSAAAASAATLRVFVNMVVLALWAAAIYLTLKGLWLGGQWVARSVRSLWAKRSRKLFQQEKDLESQSQSQPQSQVQSQYVDVPDLSYTPDSVGSPMSVGSPALSSVGAVGITTTTAMKQPLATSEALARSMKKLGIYVENSTILPAPEMPPTALMMADGYSEYAFVKERSMIKSQ